MRPRNTPNRSYNPEPLKIFAAIHIPLHQGTGPQHIDRMNAYCLHNDFLKAKSFNGIEDVEIIVITGDSWHILPDFNQDFTSPELRKAKKLYPFGSLNLMNSNLSLSLHPVDRVCKAFFDRILRHRVVNSYLHTRRICVAVWQDEQSMQDDDEEWCRRYKFHNFYVPEPICSN